MTTQAAATIAWPSPPTREVDAGRSELDGSLEQLCAIYDSGRWRPAVEKEIQDRLGDAWKKFEDLRLNYLEWNPEATNSAEVAMARLCGAAIRMLSGDHDRTGEHTLKAMRIVKLCLK